MLVWLSGNENQRGAPNENYAPRADGAVHARREQRLQRGRRPRAGPSADRLDQRLGRRPRNGQLPVRGGSPRHRPQADLRPDGELRLAGLVPALRRTIPPMPATWSGGSGPTSSRRRRRSEPCRALKKVYRRDRSIRRLVEAILMHPALYEGPRMVKPPIVQIAGMLRARSAGIDTDAWTWIADEAGQRLFQPPNVAGWDEQRWLDTARIERPLVGGGAEHPRRGDRHRRLRRRRRPRPRRSARHFASGATRSCRRRRGRSSSVSRAGSTTPPARTGSRAATGRSVRTRSGS